MLARVRWILWVAVAIALAGIALLSLRPKPPAIVAGSPVAVGGPFTLTGSDGKPFASSRLSGKPAAIFFGFTHCPDVCPTTLARLARLRRQVGGTSFAIAFITVDPERDTPAEVGKYAALFNTPVIGLTGSAVEIERVKKLFGVFSRKDPQPGGDYGVSHSAAVFVMDRDGKFVSTIAPEESDAVALAKLKRVIGD